MHGVLLFRDEYEAQQQKAMARLSKSHNQLALATSIEEGMKAQAQSQHRKIAKPQKPGTIQTAGNGTEVGSNNPEGNGTLVSGSVPAGTNSVQPVPGGGLEGPSEPTPSPAGLGSNQSTGAGVSGAAVPTSTNGIGAVIPGHSGSGQLIPAKSVSRTDSVGGDNSSNTSGRLTLKLILFNFRVQIEWRVFCMHFRRSHRS